MWLRAQKDGIEIINIYWLTNFTRLTYTDLFVLKLIKNTPNSCSILHIKHLRSITLTGLDSNITRKRENHLKIGEETSANSFVRRTRLIARTNPLSKERSREEMGERIVQGLLIYLEASGGEKIREPSGTRNPPRRHVERLLQGIYCLYLFRTFRQFRADWAANLDWASTPRVHNMAGTHLLCRWRRTSRRPVLLRAYESYHWFKTVGESHVRQLTQRTVHAAEPRLALS